MTSSVDRTGFQHEAAADRSELERARAETLNLAQWLARIANSYVKEAAPEQRTALEFQPTRAALRTKSFDRQISLELRLPKLELQFLESGEPVPHILDPEEHSPAEVEAWILVELLHRGLDRDKFSKKLPYAVAGLISGDADDHAPSACQEGLRQLTARLKAAAAVLRAVGSSMGDREARIICLPQTLDLVYRPPSWPQSEYGFSLGEPSGGGQGSASYFYASSTPANGAGSGKRRLTVEASDILAMADPTAAAAALLAKLTSR